jgi:hypothetical protein
MEVGGQRQALAALPPGKRIGTHCIGDWVGPSDGLGGPKGRSGWAQGTVWTDAENFAHAGIRYPDRPARNESLYQNTDKQFRT